MEDKVKNSGIQQIFHSMDYGESYEKVDQGIEWIKSKESTFFAYIEKSSETANGTLVHINNRVNGENLCAENIPDHNTIKKILTKCIGKKKWIETSSFERAKLLNNLAADIEKEANLLSQIEIVCRGILSKDTKTKAVPLLAQYFYYYASFAVKYSYENPNWKPEGVAVCIISNENVLSNLGLFLAPALASGYNVILQVGTTIFPAVAFIVEIAKNLGIPEEVIRLIPSDDGNLQPYLDSENVSILTLFVDLNNDKYVGVNKLNKKVLNLSSNKIPVIVFDDADLDSACTSVKESAWGYQGLLPWSVSTIVVQENVLDTFVDKLKSQLSSTKVGLGNDKLVDISTTSETSLKKLKNQVKLAKVQGIEVYQVDEDSQFFTPTIFIGGKVNTNRVLRLDEDQEANIVTVLAFRSIDEAVNLANNSRQGLAASIWTENLGIMNEVAKKLRVNNVWVNSHGLTAAEIPLSPIKDSGAGYFGGKEGFYEYVQVKKPSQPPKSSDVKNVKISSSQASFVNYAKKAQDTWWKMSKQNKAKIFQKFAEYIESNKKTLSTVTSEAFLNEWIAETYHCLTEMDSGFCMMQWDFNVLSTREPRGVIAIENDKDSELKNIRVILTALVRGNAVILITSSSATLQFYNDLCLRLPTAVFTVLAYSLNNIHIIAAHKELDAYVAENVDPAYQGVPLKQSKIFSKVTNNWNDIYRRVTFSKNVWSNIGKSITCNLATY